MCVMIDARRKCSLSRFVAIVGVATTILAILALIAGNPVQADAKTKYTKVSVLVKSTEKTVKDGYGNYGSLSTTYKYNKNGLLSVYVTVGGAGGAGGITEKHFRYSKTKLTKVLDGTQKSFFGSTVFTRNKKGLVTKSVDKVTSQISNTYKYNKSGQATKMSTTFRNYKGVISGRGTTTIKYNKKGLLIKATSKGFMPITNTYTYDSRGMVKTAKEGSRKTTYKNVYKSGKLVKRVGTRQATTGDTSRYTETTVYKYKTIKVPKSYAAKVKEQQKALFKVVPPTAPKELYL